MSGSAAIASSGFTLASHGAQAATVSASLVPFVTITAPATLSIDRVYVRGAGEGFGTADELFEILTWAQLGLHARPVGLLNVCGYFDPLLAWTDHAVREGFLKEKHRQMLLVARDVKELLELLLTHKPGVPVRKWI